MLCQPGREATGGDWRKAVSGLAPRRPNPQAPVRGAGLGPLRSARGCGGDSGAHPAPHTGFGSSAAAASAAVTPSCPARSSPAANPSSVPALRPQNPARDTPPPYHTRLPSAPEGAGVRTWVGGGAPAAALHLRGVLNIRAQCQPEAPRGGENPLSAGKAALGLSRRGECSWRFPPPPPRPALFTRGGHAVSCSSHHPPAALRPPPSATHTPEGPRAPSLHTSFSKLKHPSPPSLPPLPVVTRSGPGLGLGSPALDSTPAPYAAGCAAGVPRSSRALRSRAGKAALAARHPDTNLPLRMGTRSLHVPGLGPAAAAPGGGGVRAASREPALQSRGRRVRSARPPPAAAPRHAAPHLARPRTQIKGTGGRGGEQRGKRGRSVLLPPPPPPSWRRG